MLKACSLRMANLTMGGAPRRATVLMGPPGSDRELFIALYADAYSRLVGQLYVFTGNRADAEEIVQEHLVGGRPVERLRLADECVNTKSCPHR